MAIKDNIIQEVLFQKLAPLAITKYWNLIQQCLMESLSGQKAAPGHVARLMAAVQAGQIQAWSATSKGNPPVLAGMIFTRISEDELLGSKTLWIYGLTIKALATQQVYDHCLSELEAYAIQNGCHMLRAQTEVRGVTKILKASGWSDGASMFLKEI